MPGLAGYTSQEMVNPKLLDSMTSVMLHRPNYSVSQIKDEHFSIASIDLEQNRQKDSIESPDGRYVLTFFGRIYEPWLNCKTRVAPKLFEKWLNGGWKSLADLNGDYLIVIWERREERLTIVNDRLGLRRLHYWQGDNFFAFASEVKSLAAIAEVSRAVDEHAISELLIFGHLQDNRTLLRDVKLLPPGSYLTWQKGNLKIEKYWDYVYRVDAKLENHELAVDEYFHHTKNAVHRRLNDIDRIGLFLSGGLDSRALGAAIRKIFPEKKLLTWTAGHGHDHDSKFAKGIAKRIRSEHIPVDLPRTFLQDCGPEYAWVLDGMVSTHGSHRSCLMEEAHRKSDVIVLGFMGDTVSGGKPLDKVYQITDINELSKKGYESYAVGFDRNLFHKTLKPKVFERICGLAYESFSSTVRRASVEFPGDRVVYAELIQRQRLYNPVAQMDLQEIDGYWLTPFTDKDFIDFSLRLPWKERLHKEAYLGMICKYFPEVAGVPRSGDGLPLVHSRLREAFHWKWVLFQRHTLPKLTGGLLGGHNYGAFVHCAEWFRKSSTNFIRKKLINRLILEEHFKMDEINRMVESFLNNTAERDLMECISALMSYVLFCERLLLLPSVSFKNENFVAVTNTVRL